MRVAEKYIVLIVLILWSLSIGYSQTSNLTLDNFKPGSTQSEIALFNEEELIEVTLTTDMRTLIFDVGDVRDSHPGLLTYKDGEDSISLDILCKTRGNFRRDRSICHFPPLRIEFGHEPQAGTLFSGMKDVKLVTHCQKKKVHVNYILEEYMIYKIFNQFTDLSYKVRLARITYIDSEGRTKPETNFGFFIEPTEKMSERNGGREIELKGLGLNHVNHPVTNLFTVFQYFIANTDWSIRALHNVKLVSFSSEPMVMPVPYDFDFSGVIYTYYAGTDSILGISSVRQRLYRSNCRTLEELNPTFALFREQKQQIYDMYLNLAYLDEKRVKRILKYYDDFYETIDNPKAAKKAFEKCPNK